MYEAACELRNHGEIHTKRPPSAPSDVQDYLADCLQPVRQVLRKPVIAMEFIAIPSLGDKKDLEISKG